LVEKVLASFWDVLLIWFIKELDEVVNPWECLTKSVYDWLQFNLDDKKCESNLLKLDWLNLLFEGA